MAGPEQKRQEVSAKDPRHHGIAVEAAAAGAQEGHPAAKPRDSPLEASRHPLAPAEVREAAVGGQSCRLRAGKKKIRKDVP